MKVFASLDPRLPLTEVSDVARRAEALGYDGIHIPETIHDSFVVALLAAEHTTRIAIRTAITLAFVRSPTLVAYNAWDLARFSGGRFELGLGSQIRQNIEGRYGMAWTEPISRMEDYIGALRALFASFSEGGSPTYESDSYRITRLQPYFNPGPLDCPAPRIHLGAVNEGMCRVAGRTADGIITHSTNSDPSYLREVVIPALVAGAEAAGRVIPPIVAAATIATGSDDESVATERERQRRLLAFLYSTPAYRAALERRGFPEVWERLRDLVRADAWRDLHHVMTDDVLDALVITGPYAELAERIAAQYRGLVDGVVIALPGDRRGDPELSIAIAQIQATAP